ncbi:MAG: hypothetical protein GYA56_06655 [Geobacteraceae bacterium]|nr:hypothetical protein [Geobacteraceae bacterium]
MKRLKFFIVTCVLTAFGLFCAGAPAHAVLAEAVWGTDATAELQGSRTSGAGGGVTAMDGWKNGNLTLSWFISRNADNGLWTYTYRLETTKKDPSHFILETTRSETPLAILAGSSPNIEGPRTWSMSGSNPQMPNDIFGIKFDFGGNPVTYTLVTDRSPVYGVFYTKDGNSGGEWAVAWSNALNFPEYRSNPYLTSLDFIVRPDGEAQPSAVPLPAALWPFASGIVGLVALRQRNKARYS